MVEQDSISPSVSTPENQFCVGYRKELDAVRFVAFLLVFFAHLLAQFSGRPTEGQKFLAAFGPHSWRTLMLLGETCAMGVSLFFTLSAYLITDLLLTEREKTFTVSVRRFYIRRALRIWPLYLFGITIGIGTALLSHRSSEIVGFLFYLGFAGNIFIAVFGGFPNLMMPLWSISIEEQFYLLWPWAIRKVARHQLPLCALFLILQANVTLFILAKNHVQTGTSVWTNTFVQFEMFAGGILLALAKKHLAWRNSAVGVLLAFSGPVLWFIACSRFRAVDPSLGQPPVSGTSLMIAYGLIALGSVMVLHGFCMIEPSHFPQWAVGQGKRSYGLYVFHEIGIVIAMSFFSGLHGLIFLAASALVAFAITAGIAMLSYDYLEKPFLRIKRRFEVVHSKPI